MYVLDDHLVNNAFAAVHFASKNGGFNGTGVAGDDDDIFAGANSRSSDKGNFCCFEHYITGFDTFCNAVKFKHSDSLDHLLSLLITTLSVTATTSPSKLA